MALHTSTVYHVLPAEVHLGSHEQPSFGYFVAESRLLGHIAHSGMSRELVEDPSNPDSLPMSYPRLPHLRLLELPLVR